jgi:hypothetical protein
MASGSGSRSVEPPAEEARVRCGGSAPPRSSGSLLLAGCGAEWQLAGRPGRPEKETERTGGSSKSGGKCDPTLKLLDLTFSELPGVPGDALYSGGVSPPDVVAWILHAPHAFWAFRAGARSGWVGRA